jgi:hypothetical protein
MRYFKVFGPAFVALSTSCGSVNVTACTPGEQDACACGNQVEGFQVCKGDGSGYGECQCSDGGSGGAGDGGGGQLTTTTTGSTTTGGNGGASTASVGGGGVGGSDPCGSPAPATVTVEFESDYFDLETGTILKGMFPGGMPQDPSWDFSVAYNAQKSVHSVIFQNQGEGALIAHLHQTTFEEIGACEIVDLQMTNQLIDEPFDDTRVVILKTATGQQFKLGNAQEDQMGVTFQYVKLTPP